MGNSYKKQKFSLHHHGDSKKSLKEENWKNHIETINFSPTTGEGEVKLRKKEVKTLKKIEEDFHQRTDVFILNLLVDSIQFYKNFDKEKSDIIEHMQDREEILSTKLSQFQRKIYYVSGYEEISATHVMYQPLSEEEKEMKETGIKEKKNENEQRNVLELVSPLQIYVVQENIQVFPGEDYEEWQQNREMEDDDFASIFFTELSRNHPGYMRLRSLIDKERKSSCSSFYEDIYSYINKDEKKEDKNTGPLEPIIKISELKETLDDAKFAELKKALAAIDEDNDDSEEQKEKQSRSKISNHFDSQITFVQLNNTAPKPNGISIELKPCQEIEKNNQTLQYISLHSECLTRRRVKIKSEGDAYGIETHRELRTYLSSGRYMDCFEGDFKNLMGLLGKGHLVETSQVHIPAVLTEEVIIPEVGPRIRTEFIPTVILQSWPPCAFEWKLRERTILLDPETKTYYRWPSPKTINQVVNSGCNLVPLGHYSPSQPNPVMDIEWQIHFARAEQILLESLGHMQLRLLLLVQYLLRDHMSKEASWLQRLHLCHVLFWMCETNIRDWHEAQMGVKLKGFLKSLYSCLSKRKLSHYFIHNFNLMESVPERILRKSQVEMCMILENLPVHLMHTMSQMKTESDYYPLIDAVQVYRLVTSDRTGLEYLNPELLRLSMDSVVDSGVRDAEEDDNNEKKDGEYIQLKADLRQKRNRRIKTTNQRRKKEKKKKIKHPTINLSQRIGRLSNLRKVKVLSLFADHFIEMSRESNMYKVYQQAFRYAFLCESMASLLEESGYSSEAVNFRNEMLNVRRSAVGGFRV